MSDLFDVFRDAEAAVRVGPSTNVRTLRHSDLDLDFRPVNEVAMILNLSSTHHVHGTVDDTPNASAPTVGSITIMPPDHRFQFRVNGSCRVVAFRLPLVRLTQAFNASGRASEGSALSPSVNTDDPVLARLLFMTSAATTCPVQEQGLMAIARHLVANPGSPSRRISGDVFRGGLAPAKLQRVLEKLEANLEAPWSLAAMANEAGMSAYHFARAFATTTGWPPHRFVLRRRIQRAVEMLGDDTLSVGDVAERVGFAHHSHLARTMRRFIGLTPDVLRTRVFV